MVRNGVKMWTRCMRHHLEVYFDLRLLLAHVILLLPLRELRHMTSVSKTTSTFGTDSVQPLLLSLRELRHASSVSETRSLPFFGEEVSRECNHSSKHRTIIESKHTRAACSCSPQDASRGARVDGTSTALLPPSISSAYKSSPSRSTSELELGCLHIESSGKSM